MVDPNANPSEVPDRFLSPYRRLIVLGIISMTIAGVIPIPIGIAMLVAFPFVQKIKVTQSVEKWAPGVSILFGALYFLFPSILLLVIFTLLFQLLYLWEAKKPVHYFWISAVGLVHLAVLSTITASVVYPFLFLAYVVVLTQSLLVANFLTGLQEKDQTISLDELHQTENHFINRTKVIGNWIVGISIAIGLMIFPVLPRAQTLSYQPTQVTEESVTGFTDEVVLGEMGEIQSDNRVALRVFVPQPYSSRVQRWRGAVLDTWNHKDQGWVSSPGGSDRADHSESWIYFQGRKIEDQETLAKPIKVHVSSIGRPVIFIPEINGRSPELTVGTRGTFDQIYFDSDGWTGTLNEDYAFRTYEYDLLLLNDRAAEERGLLGTAWDEGLAKELLAPAMSIEHIPMEFIERLEDRAAELIPAYRDTSVDPERLSRDLELALMTSQDYTLDYTKETGAQNLADFVFNRKAGHCEYFATTLALMLRAKGIPSRLVTGFRGGRENFFGDYRIIRQSDAHSWVEAYIQDKGWITLDPTPSSSESTNSLMLNIGFMVDIYDYIQLQWNRYVLDYSKENQQNLLELAGRGLGYLSTHMLAIRLTLANLQNVIAGILFIVFLVWLIREIAPEVTPYLQAWSLRLPEMNLLGRNRNRHHLATRCFLKIEREFNKHGLRREPGETPRHFLDQIKASLPSVSGACQKFLSVYYSARFGNTEETEAWGDDLRESTATLLKATKEIS